MYAIIAAIDPTQSPGDVGDCVAAVLDLASCQFVMSDSRVRSDPPHA